jgi:hypothetical protein
MTKIETEHLDVPRDCLVSCKLFGITVPDFLRFIIQHFCYTHIHLHDRSEYDMATKAFLEAEKQLGEKEIVPITHLSAIHRDNFLRILKQFLKMTTNRNYSISARRDKGKILVKKMFSLFSNGLVVKDVVYYSEDIKIQLNRDFLLMTLINQRSPIELLNAMMRNISYAELAARQHLKEDIFNPAGSFFVRVMDGYGNLQDTKYLNSRAFKEFLWDVQEFRTRYFFYRNLEDRIEVYRERLEENFQRIDKPFFDYD